MSDAIPERWLAVVGYEGSYEVSDRGRVRSLDRKVRRPGPRGDLFKRGQIISQCLDTDGYPAVWLNLNRRRALRRVHRLVLDAFVSTRPEGQQALHGAAGKLVNHWPENLRWGTQEENSADKWRDGTAGEGATNPLAKLTDEIVRSARIRYADGETKAALAREAGVTDVAMGMAIRGKTWRHVTPHASPRQLCLPGME